MGNQIEICRVEAADGCCGSTYYFDWSNGHLRAVHDNGYQENWAARGYGITQKALSYLSLTDQTDRYRALQAQYEQEWRQ